MRGLDAVCVEAGTSLARAIRLTVYSIDLQDFAAVNSVYDSFFRSHRPARVALQVAALPLGARVEIDAIVAIEQEAADGR